MSVTPLCLQLFGTFEIQINDRRITRLRSTSGQRILSFLALNHKRPVERAALAYLLWPDSDHRQALYNLRRNLTDLRQHLGEQAYRLTSPTPQSLHLDLKGAVCDVLEFDSLILHSDHPSLEKAVTLYHGPLLEACSDDWVVRERIHREEAYLTIMESLAEIALESKDYPLAISRLKRILSLDAYRETAIRNLLRAYSACGDHIAATMLYREFRLRLHDDLRAEPSLETQSVYKALQPVSGLRSESTLPIPGTKLEETQANRLPQPLSNFVGRCDEMKTVRRHLESARLVALTGAGGVGKTRLAIAVAESLADEYNDSVWFVNLAPLSESAVVPLAVARVLGLTQSPESDQTQAIAQYLESQKALLILDNCEHLIEACSTTARLLLESCPSLRILVTSRQALGLQGEVVWRVPSLTLPVEFDASYNEGDRAADSATFERFDAVDLFVTRARESCPAFSPDLQSLNTIAHICRRLDGIPLAIELAAARTRSLPIEEIHNRLKSNFRILRGAAGSLPRQQTLAAAFEWSWDLLSAPERLALERLAVFTGGWSLNAAEQICAGDGVDRDEFIELLASLVEKSLVVFTPSKVETNGLRSEARYHLLETTRQFALEHLSRSGFEGAFRDRHRDYLLEWSEEVHPKLWEAEQSFWFERLEVEHHNLRSAIEWCRKQEEINKEFRFLSALSRFWDTHGHLSEGYSQLLTSFERVTPDLDPALHAELLGTAGWMAHVLGKTAASCQHCSQALAICLDAGYEDTRLAVLNFLGLALTDTGDYVQARIRLEEADDLCLRLDRPGKRTGVLNNLGRCLFRQGEFQAAIAYLEEGAALCKDLQSNQMMGVTLQNLAATFLKQGSYRRALTNCINSLELFYTNRNLVNIPKVLEYIAILLRQSEEWERAACLFGSADELHKVLSVPPATSLAAEFDEAQHAIRFALGPERFNHCFERGKSMKMDEAVCFALEVPRKLSYVDA